jgi:hypothetical protein
MSSPFLPVNPCCTDVVLNSPCGCSSTITNSSCSNNPCETNLTLSSTIVYNGPALSCIIAEPCDTLNVVLQKIDEIICNLLSQINTLSIQVTNINNEIITINTDITNINNTLGECCGSATTTTTTTECPCTYYSFVGGRINPATFIFVECNETSTTTITGDDIPVIYCVANDYPVIQIGNGAYTNTHDCCTPTTTTTSTTLPISYCYEVSITGLCTVFWIDHQGSAQSQTGTDVTINICARPGTIASGCDEGGSINIIGGLVQCIAETGCQRPTTTTTSSSTSSTTSTSTSSTTTTTTTCPCKSYDIVVSPAELALAEGATIYVSFDNCYGQAQQYEYTSAGTYTAAFCADQSKTPLEYYIRGGVIHNTTIQPEATGCCTGKCVQYTVQAAVGDGAWTALNCNGNTVHGTLIYPNITVLECLQQGSLNLTNAGQVSEINCPTTTTTTTVV